MSWDQKKGSRRRYCYICKRVPGKPHPVKIYMGRRGAGHEAAAAIEHRRQGRLEAKRLLKADRECTEEADRLAAELREWAEMLSASWMILTGHFRRRGEWRKKQMANQPKVGSRAWDRQLSDDPVYVKNTIRELVSRASGGDKQAVDSLHEWLELHPTMKSLIHELEDLIPRVERVWVEQISGNDELLKKLIKDDLAAKRANLLGSAPSVTDEILASSVLISHLAFQRAAAIAAQPTDQLEVQKAREHLMTIALKRLTIATKNWKQIAEKKAIGVRPALKVFTPEKQQASS